MQMKSKNICNYLLVPLFILQSYIWQKPYNLVEVRIELLPCEGPLHDFVMDIVAQHNQYIYNIVNSHHVKISIFFFLLV